MKYRDGFFSYPVRLTPYRACNPAARYLMARAGSNVKNAVAGMWGIYDDILYEAALAALEEAVVAHLEQHPELKTEENHEDMLDFRNNHEDVDDSYDEEDEYYAAMDAEADEDDEEEW